MGAQRRRKGFGVDQWVGGDLGNKRRERRAEEEGYLSHTSFYNYKIFTIAPLYNN